MKGEFELHSDAVTGEPMLLLPNGKALFMTNDRATQEDVDVLAALVELGNLAFKLTRKVKP